MTAARTLEDLRARMRCGAPWRNAPKQARYLGVGAVCAVASNALVLLIASFGFNYVAASALSLIPMFFIGYGLHVTITFDVDASAASFARYCLGVVASYPTYLFFMFIFASLLTLPLTIAAPATTVVMIIWNYASAHWALVRPARS